MQTKSGPIFGVPIGTILGRFVLWLMAVLSFMAMAGNILESGRADDQGSPVGSAIGLAGSSVCFLLACGLIQVLTVLDRIALAVKQKTPGQP